MIYTTAEDKKKPLEPIKLSLRKLPVLRECEVVVKNTGIRAVFTVVKHDRENNEWVFMYECMPVLSFKTDDLGFENTATIKRFMERVASIIEYRASTSN